MLRSYRGDASTPCLVTRETAAALLVDWAAALDTYLALHRDRVEVVFVEPAELDDCAGCPDAQGAPNDAEGVIVYRRHGSAWTYRVPVARCCAGAEINHLLAYPVPLAELRVEIPIPVIAHAAAAA
jgi:hypothetical protein